LKNKQGAILVKFLWQYSGLTLFWAVEFNCGCRKVGLATCPFKKDAATEISVSVAHAPAMTMGGALFLHIIAIFTLTGIEPPQYLGH